MEEGGAGILLGGEPMTEIDLASRTAAATDRSLLQLKAAVREAEGIMDDKREIICRMLNNAFEIGFSLGAQWMGKKVKEIMDDKGVGK